MRQTMTRLPFELQRALSHCENPNQPETPKNRVGRCHNRRRQAPGRAAPARRIPSPRPIHLATSPLATEHELSDFLKSVEKRSFKRALYHVRNEESALDIVQDSMMKLAESYGDKPAAELPMLYQRILSNCTLDWFRRNKTRTALFSNISEFEHGSDDGDFDLLEVMSDAQGTTQTESAQDATQRAQTLREIETEIQQLPLRQREAFMMRYWEEMDVTETAEAMGCSEGSVKTHCSRAVLALARALRARGISI